MRRLGLFLVATLGCGGSSSSAPPLLPGFQVPPPPSSGFQVVLPIVKGLAPGSDTELCTWTDKIADRDLDIKTLEAFQSELGHHVVLYLSPTPQPAGTTHECVGTDTVNFRFVAGSGGEGQGRVNTAPGDLVYRVPAGSQLVVNHHYINATNHPGDAQSGINVTFADASATHVPSSSLVFLDTELRIPPGGGSVDVHCTMQRDLDAWYFIPHMHQWGTHITIDRTSASGTDRVFDVDWNPEYTFNPPGIRRDPSMPFSLKTGDVIAVHCDYTNPMSTNLTFGLEMCVAFGATIDAQNIGNLVCDAGSWGSF